MSKQVTTFCRICLSGCGVKVTVSDDGRVERIGPDKENPYSWRDFCAKARSAGDLVEHPRRIVTPMRRVGDSYVEASWEEAATDIGRRLRRIVDEHGPEAVASFWGNPAAMSSSNVPFFNGLLDAIGTTNRYWPGSVDNNNYHLVAEIMYGNPLIVLTPDVDACRCFLFVGMNPAHSRLNWVTNVPNGWKRVLAAQERGADLIVVDPLVTDTTVKADTHVQILPGTDWAFLLGLIKVILDNGWEDRGDCAQITGFEHVRALVEHVDLADLSERCEVPVESIGDIARRFALAPTAVCMTQTGVSQNTTGTIGEWFGQLLNAITGRLDRPGGRRFEPGYVDAARMWSAFAKSDLGLSRISGLPARCGHRFLGDLPDEITTPGPGQVRAMLINGGNPVVTGPDGAALDDALSRLELLVAVDLVQRESHRHAHWLIPGTHWLERDDLMPVASVLQEAPFAQYGRAAIDPPPGVLEEWEFYTNVAIAMGKPMFGIPGVNKFIRASRQVAQLMRRPQLAFDAEWMDHLLVGLYRRVKLKDVKAAPHGMYYRERTFGHLKKALHTKDKRVHWGSDELLAEVKRQLAGPKPAAPDGYPFLMSNRRHSDSMNSGMNELRGLHRSRRTTLLEIHPDDAAKHGVNSGETVRVSSPVGSVELEALVTKDTRAGVVVIPHGWGSRIFDPTSGGEPIVFGVNRNLLINRTDMDPLSQTTPMNSSWVRVDPV